MNQYGGLGASGPNILVSCTCGNRVSQCVKYCQKCGKVVNPNGIPVYNFSSKEARELIRHQWLSERGPFGRRLG